ncbi:endoplasmic reticulum resident protein 27 isoform 2 [Mus musculus]|uniref:Uncharacterized protein n=1 Tax=Mus musculus TaxID=10090 RepID=Q9D8Q5_MOUSE|nr:endoplasmic reticulum resident protein 27 isoform 2 [Mus musculus]BAB25265.1 unnamed protein product [Mus musculus]
MARQFQDVSFGISNHSEVLTHYNVTSNSICLFRLVDDQQLHLNAEDIENLDAAKLSRFIHVNNLHWVTEYSPMVNTGPCGQSYALVSGRVLAPGTEMFSRLLVPVSH